MNRVRKHISVIIILLFVSCFAYSQKPAKSEDDVKENAKEHFSNGEYSAALPLYSQLLSLYPKDPNYSYRFGACKLFSEKDKEAPLTYLEFGANDPNVEPEAYFFLGKAYHLNYRFDEALAQYKKFEEKGDAKSQENLLLKRHIAMCGNGKKLLKNITDLVVLDKKTLNKTDFFRNYDLSEFGGKIIKTPDEFKLPYDIKKKKESIMYLQPNADVVYFSSYGEEGTNGKDIYFAKKTPDGSWGKPQVLAGPVNTEFDEDYPFIHPNGKELYFASNGHNSMGGYDVFKSEFDEASQQWSYPQNIDFAINTPGDDYLYITDMDEKNAYFSSTRESGEDEVTVYRVKVERVPVDIAIIKGIFIADATKAAKITIEDLKDNKIVGVYNTNSTTGDYILTVPNGGKFKFVVETTENPVMYSGIVEIPRQKTLKQLKQEMQLTAENGEQRLVIKNLFDEDVGEEATVLMAEILKEKASLEVNVNEIKQDTIVPPPVIAETKVDSTAKDSAVVQPVKPSVTVKTENISNEEIIKIAKEDAQNSQKEASDQKLETAIAYSIANEKNRVSAEKANEAESFLTGAVYATDPADKQQKLDKAKTLKKESKQLAEQAVAAYNLARELEKNAAEKQKEADMAFNYAQELENAVQQNSPEATTQKLAQLNEFLEKQKQEEKKGNTYADLQKQLEEKQKDVNTQTKLAQKLQDDVKNLEADISVLKQAAKNEKKKKDRERMEQQASVLERDLPSMQSEAQTAKETAEKKQKELLDLEKQESILSSVVSQIKTSDKTSVTSLNETDKSKLETDISSSQERITKLEQELASDTTAAKTEEPLVSVVNKDNKTDTSQAKTTPADGQASSDKTTSTQETEEPVPADYENYYKQKNETNETQPDAVKKEEVKAKNYENWARAMEKEATELKQKSEQVTDETEKNTLKEKAATLENSAKEKRQISQESQATAAQLRLSKTTAETTSASSSTNTSSESPAIAVYSEKYISTEKNAQSIQNEKDKAVTLAEINKEWATEISKEITTLQSGVDTIQDENKKSERKETIRLLEELKKEKESKAQQYTEKALETPAATSTGTTTTTTNAAPSSEASFEAISSSVAKEEVPADYNSHFENKIKEQEQKKISNSSSSSSSATLTTSSSKEEEIKAEETKAVYYATWANSIDKETQQLKAQSDTTTIAEEKRALDEKIVKSEVQKEEKKTKQYESKVNAIDIEVQQLKSLSATTFNDNEKRTTEEKIVNLEVLKEENKAKQYESQANAFDKEVRQLKSQSDTTANEEEKRITEEKIVKLEVQKKEKSDLSAQSKEQAKQWRQSSPASSSASSGTTTSASSGTVSTTDRVVSLQDQTFTAQMDNYKKQETAASTPAEKNENQIKEEEFKSELYNNWSSAIDKDVQQLKVLRDLTTSEPEKQKLENLIIESEKASKQKKELAKQSQEKTMKLREESANITPEVSEEKVKIEVEKTESASSAQQADSLQTEAVLKRDKANQMGFFKRKKKAAMLADAQKTETESEINREKSELATERANLIEQSSKVEISDELQNKFAYKKLEDRAKSLESDAVYLDDQAKATKDSLAIVKKKKQKNEIFDRATALEQKAAAKRTEASKFTALSSELKAKEDSSFMDLLIKTIAASEKNDSILPFEKMELDSAEMEMLKENEVQKAFAAKRKEYKKLYLQREVEDIESQKFRSEAGTQLTQFSAASTGLDTIKDKKIREQFIKDALEFANQARNKISTADSLNYDAKSKEKNADTRTRDAVAELYTINDMELFRKILAYQYLKPPDTIPPVAVLDTTPKDTVPKIPVVEETFTIGGNAPVYDDKNPIPLNPKYPGGLIWQVQIGAFRNPIPQNLFKGFAPVMGVKLSDNITRYSAGMFKTFSNANSARSEIVTLGYKDAFVVAYRDGQRISITEARALIAKGLFASPTDISATPETTIASGNMQVGSNGQSQLPPLGGGGAGLFYTVQIGVYSKPATDKQLKNVKPVNSEKLDNGTIRYSSGVYNDFASAADAKNKIVDIGINDAFVTAYYNGKRITIAEAKTLSKGGVQRADGAAEKVLPIREDLGGATGIVFKVQLGKYIGDVPESEAKQILEFSRKNSKQYKDADGSEVYLAGIFKDFASAEKLKNEAVSTGLINAIVVAFNNGTSMNVEEAKKNSQQ